MPLCGNVWIFLSLRFYVKSNLENVEVLKIAIFAKLGVMIFVNLVSFSLQKVQKFIKMKIEMPKIR